MKNSITTFVAALCIVTLSSHASSTPGYWACVSNAVESYCLKWSERKKEQYHANEILQHMLTQDLDRDTGYRLIEASYRRQKDLNILDNRASNMADRGHTVRYMQSSRLTQNKVKAWGDLPLAKFEIGDQRSPIITDIFCSYPKPRRHMCTRFWSFLVGRSSE